MASLISGRQKENQSLIRDTRWFEQSTSLLYSFLFLGELPQSEIAAKLACWSAITSDSNELKANGVNYLNEFISHLSYSLL